MSKMTVKECFVCGENIECEMHEDEGIQEGWPYGGLWFRARGNFGSTIFDPMMNHEYLEVLICDECVKAKAKSIRHIYSIIEPRPIVKSRTFDKTEEVRKEEMLKKCSSIEKRKKK